MFTWSGHQRLAYPSADWYASSMTAKERKQQLSAMTYWRQSALRDQETAKQMHRHKHFDWSLFIYHLAIEKLLKALIISQAQTPLYSHDLVRLAHQAKLEINDDKHGMLAEISKFNIEARYAEEKLALYDKATPDFTAIWHVNCEQIFLWVQKYLNQKD